jgi:peptidyl-prolyl cis-trans isomerase SurA
MFRVLLTAAFGLTIFLQTFAQQSATLFTVAQKPVTAEEFIYLYRKNHLNKNEDFTKEKVEEYLTLYINFKLKVTEAQQRGRDTTQAFIKEFNGYKEDLRKPYLPDAKLIDSLVHLTYNRMKEEVSASHILVAVKPDANPADTLAAYNKITELRNRAVQGEDFKELASAYSEDPSAKINQGQLGYFTALQMVYPFENAAFNTKVGEISQPVKTNFGYHILKVNDRRPSRGEVEVSHILIRTGDNQDNEQAKNLIFDIYDKLQKGVHWDELCKEYSEDPSSKENGGRLRPFGVGVMASVPEFEKVAFELQNPGDISDPFETAYGWHIVKLERKIPLQPLEQLSATLKPRVARDERVHISKKVLYDKIKRDFAFSENSKVKAQVFSLADSSLTKGKFTPAPGMSSKETLFSLNKTEVAAAVFMDYIRKNQKPSRLSPQQYMEQLYQTFVEQKLIEVLEANILDKSQDYKWLLKEYYEGILLFDIMEKEVWNRASEDSVGLLDYYNNNSGRYKAGERIQADIYSSTTKDHIHQLKQLIQKDDSVSATQLIERYKIHSETGNFEKSDRAIFSKIPWAVGVYEMMNNNLNYLIVVKGLLPPGVKTFEEAKAEVISDYQNHLEQRWIASLKKKYPVKLNKKVKASVVEQLTSKATQ